MLRIPLPDFTIQISCPVCSSYRAYVAVRWETTGRNTFSINCKSCGHQDSLSRVIDRELSVVDAWEMRVKAVVAGE